jgi:hypothetical protein
MNAKAHGPMQQVPAHSSLRARALHSIHPSLALMSGMAQAPEAVGVGAAQVPYPTAQQYAALETAYRHGLAAASPPPRQPPSMLAAMQRPDLTQESRQKILQNLTPRSAGLEKKHKVIFCSDARRDPLRTSTNDFTVDVTPDILPARAHGFEVVGYSITQGEWTIPADESALPWRFGWCASPGSRSLWFSVASIAAQQSPRPLFGPARTMTLEQPLQANPVVSIAVEPNPLALRLTFARRVGSAISALVAAGGSAWLEFSNIEHAFPGIPARVQLTASSFVNVIHTEYIDADGPPEPEPLLGEAWNGFDDEIADGDASPLPALPLNDAHVLLVTLAGYTPQSGAAAWLAGGMALGSLGRLIVLPPKGAVELASRSSAQLAAMVRQRAFLEQADPTRLRLPLRSARLRWIEEPYPFGIRPTASPPHVHRFAAEFGWEFGGLSEAVRRQIAASSAGAVQDLCPVRSMGADPGWQRRLGLPVFASLAALAQHQQHSEADLLVVIGATPPRHEYGTGAPRLPALADGSSSPDVYYRALQGPATSLLFGPSAGAAAPSPAVWELPIRNTNGAVVRVQIPAGEYRPWDLAAEITRRLRGAPTLAPLQLACEPRFDPAGFVRGFRFYSAAGLVFGIAWELDEPQIVDPARLGFRKFAETGLPDYEPHADLAAIPSTAFPLADLGTGVPAPPPTVPTILPLANSRKTQIIHQAKPTERVTTAEVVGPHLLATALTTQRGALYHNLQPVRITGRLPAQGLIFGTAPAGSPEADAVALISGSGALSAAELLLPPEPDPLFPVQGLAPSFYDPAQIRALMTLIHDPVAGSLGSLFDVLTRLLGVRGRAYGTVSPIAPSGTMDADGPYRTLLATISPSSLPSVDALLDQVADGRQLREAVNALATLILRIIQGPILQGVPLHLQPPPLGNLATVNGGVAATGLAFVLALYRTSNVTAGPRPPRDVLIDLVSLHAQLQPPVAAPGSQIVPGYPYLVPALPQALNTLAASRITIAGAGSAGYIFVVSPGRTGSNDRVGWTGGPVGGVVVRPMNETGAGVTIAAFAGSIVHLTHSLALSPSAVQDPNLVSWRVVEAGLVELVLPHNLASGAVTFSFGPGPVLTTVTLTDSPLTQLAKMLVIAGAYAASVEGLALEQPIGTTAHPYDASSAVASLGWTGTDTPPIDALLVLAPDRTRQCRAIFTQAAITGVSANLLGQELVTLALRSMDVPQFDPVSGDPLPPLRAVLALSRLNEHPFSADWASELRQHVRPSRLGFEEGEYPSALELGSVFIASLASPHDADRSHVAYLLLDVEINPTTQEERSVSAPGYQYGSTMGELFSLSSSAATDRDRQIVRCVAYVEVGSDGSTLRLLDRQDDRSPVLFPTGMTVGRVRFRFLRPDGSLYNSAGRKVMVALRFFTQTDTPNAFDLGKDQEAK